MSGPASVGLELLAHVLAPDLDDGVDALAGQRRKDASLKEVAVPVDGGLTAVAQPQVGKPVA